MHFSTLLVTLSLTVASNPVAVTFLMQTVWGFWPVGVTEEEHVCQHLYFSIEFQQDCREEYCLPVPQASGLALTSSTPVPVISMVGLPARTYQVFKVSQTVPKESLIVR